MTLNFDFLLIAPLGCLNFLLKSNKSLILHIKVDLFFKRVILAFPFPVLNFIPSKYKRRANLIKNSHFWNCLKWSHETEPEEVE